MCMSFTEHIRTFGRDCDPAACVLPRLAQLLRQRMRRKNLLNASPSHLGYDAPDWNAPEAFDDLTADCYVFAFVTRIVGLRNQLRVRENIDGLIVRNVDNFLTDRQKRRDPIGYAVFGNLESAVVEALQSGAIRVDGMREGRLQGDDVLRFQVTDGATADPGELHGAVAADPSWTDALPALTEAGEAGSTWMGAFLTRVGASGLAAVRVCDLVGAVAARARSEWVGRHATPDGELAFEGGEGARNRVRLMPPASGTDEADLLDVLRRRIPRLITGEAQLRVRNGLTAVFVHWIAMIEESGLARPSQAELAERLGMSETTLSDYLVRLRRMVATILPEKPEA